MSKSQHIRFPAASWGTIIYIGVAVLGWSTLVTMAFLWLARDNGLI